MPTATARRVACLSTGDPRRVASRRDWRTSVGARRRRSGGPGGRVSVGSRSAVASWSSRLTAATRIGRHGGVLLGRAPEVGRRRGGPRDALTRRARQGGAQLADGLRCQRAEPLPAEILAPSQSHELEAQPVGPVEQPAQPLPGSARRGGEGEHARGVGPGEDACPVMGLVRVLSQRRQRGPGSLERALLGAVRPPGPPDQRHGRLQAPADQDREADRDPQSRRSVTR